MMKGIGVVRVASHAKSVTRKQMRVRSTLVGKGAKTLSTNHSQEMRDPERRSRAVNKKGKMGYATLSLAI
jgi:hypothetical protein